MESSLIRLRIAAQIMSSLVTLNDFTDEQAIDLSVKLADALLAKAESVPNIPDPAWDYATLWGILTTAEARIKSFKQYLSEFEMDHGDRDTNDQMYCDLMEVLHLINAGLKDISNRGISEKP